MNSDNSHEYLYLNPKIEKNKKKTLIVVILTFVTMIIEIVYGVLTSSMALLSDGIHMASHAGALGIAFLAYQFAFKKQKDDNYSYGIGKIIPLSGYTNSLLLTIISFFMIVQSVERLIDPKLINYDDAIIVAIIGLVVNIISAFILTENHDHDHDHNHHHDHNIRSAYIHVLADALTSIFAIIALFMTKKTGYLWPDPLMGIVGGIIVFKWGIELGRTTARELLDKVPANLSLKKIQSTLEKEFPNAFQILDLHLRFLAPKVVSCELVLNLRPNQSFPIQKIKEKIQAHYPEIIHIIIEERKNNF